MNEPIISFRHVQKSFDEKVVYKDLSFDVFAGETFTVIGGSGQGKSVMLKMLTGLLSADGGSIRFAGNEIAQLEEREFLAIRKKIAMLFQGGALFDSLDVRENVAYPLRLAGKIDETRISEEVERALGLVGLDGFETRRPGSLSAGMKKRVGLARAIAAKPDVLLYDEPTTGLDPTNVLRINALIEKLNRELELTSIVVTHDMSSVFGISHRVAMIDGGEIIFVGTKNELLDCADRRVADFIRGRISEQERAS